MKINYTMTGTGLTGGTRVLLNVADRLADRGHEVIITSLADEGDDDWYSTNPNFRTNYVSNNKRRYLLGAAQKLTESHAFDQYQIQTLSEAIPDCDINVATKWKTAFSVHRSNKGQPFYHMQHHEPVFVDEEYKKRHAKESYYLPIEKIANSIWLKNIMQEEYSANTPIVNPAIDHSVFYPREDIDDNLAQIDPDKFTVLSFAKETRWKGFPEALEALSIAKDKKDDIQFLAYGKKKPSYKSPVNYEFVKFPSDEELAQLYSNVDAVISASWYESFPLPPIEAMACETPVVTTRLGTEDYANDRKNAMVVPPKEPEEMAKAILTLKENEQLRDQISENARSTANEYTWESTVDRVENIFEQKLRQED